MKESNQVVEKKEEDTTGAHVWQDEWKGDLVQNDKLGHQACHVLGSISIWRSVGNSIGSACPDLSDCSLWLIRRILHLPCQSCHLSCYPMSNIPWLPTLLCIVHLHYQYYHIIPYVNICWWTWWHRLQELSSWRMTSGTRGPNTGWLFIKRDIYPTALCSLLAYLPRKEY